MKKVYCGHGDHYRDESKFWKRGNKLQPNCIECQSAINKARYEKNSSSHIKKVTMNSTRRQKLFQEWKQHLQCCICPETVSKCLDFHHLDPEKKDFAVSDGFRTVGLHKIILELKKCIVVCKNCHVKIHEGIIQIPTPIPFCQADGLEEKINGIVV